MKKNFYITTTLPYANGKAHIGHTLEFIRADVFSRTKKLSGHKVFFNTGIDEHGLKNYQKAEDLKIDVMDYLDSVAQEWKDFTKKIAMEYDFFSRTTSRAHKISAQENWKICEKKGYIYKKQYETKYCVGCESEKTNSELVAGKCPDHMSKELEIINEENYFFKFSAFEKELLSLYKKNGGLVVPEYRQLEIKNFVEAGLQDFSISRLKSKMPWGVSVPGDDDHVMYVWFDALMSYISAVAWPHTDIPLYQDFYENAEVVQFCGKDNLRFQSAMWQAILLANGVKNSDKIFVEGHILSDGKKMSKSMGNVIDPEFYIEKYGAEALRYFLCRHIHNHQDSDFTEKRFLESYNADLVNGVGNLTNRILQMAENASVKLPELKDFDFKSSLIHSFDFNGELEIIWKKIGEADELISENKTYKKIKDDLDGARVELQKLLVDLHEIAIRLKPIMPETSVKIINAILELKKPSEPIFPRIK